MSRAARQFVALMGLGAVMVAALAAVVRRDGGVPVDVPSYTAPRTPWGEPDLQGTYTNEHEFSAPMERPEAFANRRAGEITQTELARLNDQRRRALEETRGSAWEEHGEAPRVHNSRAWLITDPPDGKIPSVTTESLRRGITRARGLRSADVQPWAQVDLVSRCITRGLPGSMLPRLDGNNLYELIQGPGIVAITYEMINETRVIPLSGGAHVGSGIRSYMGDARGHFDGDSLVVETTNFSGAGSYRGSSERLRIVERFTPIARDRLEWSVTLHDPETWTRSWSFAMTLARTSERRLEFACHEGNYALRHMLSSPGPAAP
jgi:hypothetical protein